jgi:nucleoside-diphosphate-sugar epimerase
MKYLVTGCAGFIGSHLVDALLDAGHDVVGLDNFATGHRHNIEHNLGRITFIEGDIRDPETCHRACEGVDKVLHQAALGSVPRSIKDPQTSHAANATGTLNMLVAARDAAVSGFVFAASSSVYGDTPSLPKVETMPERPLSPYAITKLAGERYLRTFADIYGLPTVGLRYFNVFGPRQDPNGAYAAVIPKFIALAMRGESPQIHGDGEQTRDFTFIENVVQANLAAAERAPEIGGTIMNVACGDRISINQLWKSISAHLGCDVDAVHTDPRPGDVRDSLADITLARESIGYEPRVEVDEGLQRTVEWFQNQ